MSTSGSVRVWYIPFPAQELQFRAADKVVSSLSIKNMQHSPVLKTVVDLDTENPQGDAFLMKFISDTLEYIPPTKAIDLVRKILWANSNWDTHSQQLLIQIYEEQHLSVILLLTSYLSTENTIKNVYSHVGRVLSAKLSTTSPPPPWASAVLERLLDQANCLSLSSPRVLSNILKSLESFEPYGQKRLTKYLLDSQGPEKAVSSLLTTCKELVRRVGEEPVAKAYHPTIADNKRRSDTQPETTPRKDNKRQCPNN